MKSLLITGALFTMSCSSLVVDPTGGECQAAGLSSHYETTDLLSKVPEIIPLVQAAEEGQAKGSWSDRIGTLGHALPLVGSDGRKLGEIYRIRSPRSDCAIFLVSDGDEVVDAQGVRFYEMDWPLLPVSGLIDVWVNIHPQMQFAVFLVLEGDRIVIRLSGDGEDLDLESLSVSPQKLGLIKAD